MSKPDRGHAPAHVPHPQDEVVAPSGSASRDSGRRAPGQLVESPRGVIRGESTPVHAPAIVDWLSFTVHEGAVAHPMDWAHNPSVYLQVSDLEVGPAEKGTAGFLHSAPLVIPRAGDPVHVGKIAWGGESQRKRVYLSLSAALCNRVSAWEPMTAILDIVQARITRVDLAHDDYDGRRNVDDAVAMYDAGMFKSGGRNPICSCQGDWKLVSGHGRTFYVGKRGHGKLLRVYEKGKQLGDTSSPWVRWEVEFHNRDRVIPADVLCEPARYLAGAFPALSFVSEERTAIRTQRKALQASLGHLIECLSKSYGKTINAMVMQGLDPHDIVAMTLRGGVPDRLKRPLAGLPKGEVLYEARHGEP